MSNPFVDMNSGPPAPTITKPKYRFKVKHRNFAMGDPVPADLGEGVIKTMLAYGRIELIPADTKAQRKRKDEAVA